MMLHLLLFCTTLLATAKPMPAETAHDFHVSKCLIEYNPQVKALQISMHIFIDDLELALESQGTERLFICTRMEHPKAETYMQRYLEQNFQLSVNKKSIKYNFLGKEISEDMAAVWCYLEITDITAVQSVQVTNSLLMEVYDDQKNLVQIKVPGKKQGYFMFEKGRSTDKVEF
jgi:myo-inositol catabolism protein IolC